MNLGLETVQQALARVLHILKLSRNGDGHGFVLAHTAADGGARFISDSLENRLLLAQRLTVRLLQFVVRNREDLHVGSKRGTYT